MSGVLVLSMSLWVKPSSVSAPPASMMSSLKPPSRRSMPSSTISPLDLGPAEDLVVAGAAEHLVVAGAGIDRVVLLLAEDDVVAGPAVELVGAAAAAEDVVAGAALDDVVVAAAVDAVVAAAPVEHVLAAQAGDAVRAVGALPVVDAVVELLLDLEADRRLLREPPTAARVAAQASRRQGQRKHGMQCSWQPASRGLVTPGRRCSRVAEQM